MTEDGLGILRGQGPGAGRPPEEAARGGRFEGGGGGGAVSAEEAANAKLLW